MTTNKSDTPLDVTIITGMSGAGRSEAARVLEDLGFFKIDGLPPALIGKVAELARGVRVGARPRGRVEASEERGRSEEEEHGDDARDPDGEHGVAILQGRAARGRTMSRSG